MSSGLEALYNDSTRTKASAMTMEPEHSHLGCSLPTRISCNGRPVRETLQHCVLLNTAYNFVCLLYLDLMRSVMSGAIQITIGTALEFIP